MGVVLHDCCLWLVRKHVHTANVNPTTATECQSNEIGPALSFSLSFFSQRQCSSVHKFSQRNPCGSQHAHTWFSDGGPFLISDFDFKTLKSPFLVTHHETRGRIFFFKCLNFLHCQSCHRFLNSFLCAILWTQHSESPKMCFVIFGGDNQSDTCLQCTHQKCHFFF